MRFTPHTRLAFQIPSGERGGRNAGPPGIPPSRSVANGGHPPSGSITAAACELLSTARTFSSWTRMSGGSMLGQLQLGKTRGLSPATSMTCPTITPYSVPDPSDWVR